MPSAPTGIAGAMDYKPHAPGQCYVCGGSLRDGVGIAARALPGLGVVQACSKPCAAAAKWLVPVVLGKVRRRK